MKMPISAPRPVPTMIAVGVASPIAQGHAMTRTETNERSAAASFGPSGPNTSHTASVTTAMPNTTGTNTAATRSARRWMGAFEPCASSTILMMWASTVSRPVRVALKLNAPVALMEPPTTSSPGPLSTGTLSPVIMDSSTADEPERTVPSTGILPPGRTSTVSPGTTSRTATSISLPSRTTSARFGARSASLRTACEARLVARCSRNLPRSTSVMIMALVSKYTWPSPAPCGSACGANVATVLRT